MITAQGSLFFQYGPGFVEYKEVQPRRIVVGRNAVDGVVNAEPCKVDEMARC